MKYLKLSIVVASAFVGLSTLNMAAAETLITCPQTMTVTCKPNNVCETSAKLPWYEKGMVNPNSPKKPPVYGKALEVKFLNTVATFAYQASPPECSYTFANGATMLIDATEDSIAFQKDGPYWNTDKGDKQTFACGTGLPGLKTTTTDATNCPYVSNA